MDGRSTKNLTPISPKPQQKTGRVPEVCPPASLRCLRVRSIRQLSGLPHSEVIEITEPLCQYRYPEKPPL
jgi:hypothetical protein